MKFKKSYTLLIFLLIAVAPIHGQHCDEDVRLVGGSYQWEGRVEILDYFSGTWGTITDSEWTNDEAKVVCRKLGHYRSGAVAYSHAYFGEGRGSIHLDSVHCSGLELSLTSCDTHNDGIKYSHSLDVGVKCQPSDEAYREGDIRLVGGAYNWEGRVEVYWMGEWGAISDSSWTADDATVVCTQLKLSSGHGVVVPCCDRYGEGSGTTYISNVACTGTETRITNCNLDHTITTSHHHDVGVRCQQGDDVTEGDLRLVGGSYLWQGRVEIFLFGVWGTISDVYAEEDEGRVVCRQLGYRPYRVSYRHAAMFGKGTGQIHFKDLICSGSEYRVNECQYNNNIRGESHSEDWSVLCYTDGPEPGDVHLTGENEGRVEVFLLGTWIPIGQSNITWTNRNSKVVCRELGYDPEESQILSKSTVWNPGTILIDNVNCIGSETKLTDCHHDTNDLRSYKTIVMSCRKNYCSTGDMRLVGGETDAEGRVEMCNGGAWGTLCYNDWTETCTAVVCRYLGFSDIIGDSEHFTSEKFGSGTGPVFVDYISCTGTEPRIWADCSYFKHYYGCSQTDDVGVRCQPASCYDGQIKLIEGYTEQSGRVEICSNQRWETLSTDEWTSMAATVACFELGFSGYQLQHWKRDFGSGGGPKHSKYYQCEGAELKLLECNSPTDRPRTLLSYDVGVICELADCVDGEVRLSEGETEYDGRLEVCFSGRWGTVRSEGWSQNNSEVVCSNALGYDITDDPQISIHHTLSKPVHLHNVVCPRTALTLTECTYSRYSGNINTITDIKVTCHQPFCSSGDLKLVGGRSASEGRLRICFNKRWNTINGDGWTSHNTRVVCRQLGYLTSDISQSMIGRSSESLPVSISHLRCQGTEEMLLDCDHQNYSDSVHASIDVKISCSSTTCGNCNESGGTMATSDPTSDPRITIAIVVPLSLALLCSLVIAVITVIVYKLKKRSRCVEEKGKVADDINSPSSKENVAISENISYIPTRHPKSSQSSEAAPYYEQLPPVKDDQHTSSLQQPLPPILLTPITQGGDDKNDPIYDLCK